MSFDYKSSEVFGLDFKQHDARSIRHILKHYGDLPENQGDRLALFLRLQSLEKNLHEDDRQKIKNWLANGGDLPRPVNLVIAYEEEFEKEPEEEDEDSKEEEEDAGDEEEDYEEDSDESTSFESLNSATTPGHEFQIEDLGSDTIQYDHFGLMPTHPDIHERANYVSETKPESTPEPETTEGYHGSEKGDGEESRKEESDEEESDEGKSEEDTKKETVEATGSAKVRKVGKAKKTFKVTVEPGSEYVANTGYYAGGKADNFEHPPFWAVECVICAVTVLTSETWCSITDTCEHPNGDRTCKACLNTSISTAVEYGLLNGIKCPLCPAVLTYNDISQKASADVFERYSYLREKASRPDTFTMCLGPNCGGGQIHEGPEPLMICSHCRFRTCVKHMLPWHEGQSCDDFDIDDSQIERLEQEEATAKLLAKDSRMCPKCQECVVRSEGCDHMQCRCGKSWCYLCGVDWENTIRLGRTAHGRNCPNHPDSSKLSQNQISARETNLTQLVHGGPVNELLTKAKYAKQKQRRDELRPLALAAAEQRMKDEALAKRKSPTSGPAKKKAKLVAPWKEH
ncbi:e353e3c9-b53f-4bfd-bbc3-6680492c8174 [Sclerotinia trifoliorum]|uniref:RBR-type E3 ubiquitin transferase n=1 Tax=Sclerotinia trifoliorum TaxID=28548 RepID=A0A8H2ZLD6_9HELO|nr:e353e3c9-b53f-4bfd-bbc3-6680492c8174 [Sclerotinia trifoliorum]